MVQSVKKTPYSNYVDWYKKHLHEVWFEGLSEKEIYLHRQEVERRKRRMALNQLMMLPTIMSNALTHDIRNHRRYDLWK